MRRSSAEPEGPAHDFFLSYPYLLVWTDQVDVWRFSDSSELTHITTLEVYVTKPSGPTPFIDHARGLLILPEPIRVGPPQLRIFTLRDGELARDRELYGRLADVDIQYRQADGHALVLVVEDAGASQPHGKTSIVEVDVAGIIWLQRQPSQSGQPAPASRRARKAPGPPAPRPGANVFRQERRYHRNVDHTMPARSISYTGKPGQVRMTDSSPRLLSSFQVWRAASSCYLLAI
ncbi:hypothetical protein FB451DRAFT_1419899 [Mycena latifolia]|nr:hypothetical protein FB451DRAFT_1419899 [Mycena latifolia]